MTTDKDFKRLVRGRMQKTGESYTAARAHLLQHKPKAVPSTAGRPARPKPGEYAGLAGHSDAVMKANTGCTWARWVNALDHAGAEAWRHREIVKHIHQRYKTPMWWAQTVTVGYERIKGKRVIGQRLDGSFEVGKSKTFPVPVSRLYAAFHDPAERAAWLTGVTPTVRTARREKTMRLGWPDRTTVVVGFDARGAGKSQVAIQHTKLPDRATSDSLKRFWTERLEALSRMLAARDG